MIEEVKTFRINEDINDTNLRDFFNRGVALTRKYRGWGEFEHQSGRFTIHHTDTFRMFLNRNYSYSKGE